MPEHDNSSSPDIDVQLKKNIFQQYFNCILRVKVISDATGWRKRATSSAYIEILCWIGLLDSSCSNSASDALVIIQFRTSMTSIKSIGDRGSLSNSSPVLYDLPKGAIKKDLSR